jgi:tRNA dimethylallyltransferase
MAIGTAQPTPEELAAVPHYFIDAFPPSEEISAARFETLALGWLEEIFRTSDTAVVCGGTGLYIRALTEGLDPMPPVDDAIEADIEKGIAEKGISWLQKRVREEDPLFWESGEQDNPRRLARALAFRRSHGTSIMAYRSGRPRSRPFRTIKVYLELPREVLYGRINQRVDRMMERGLEEEARALFPLRGIKNLDTVGYRELFGYFEGKMTLAAAVDKIRQHSRNYAKRQETWFRREPGYVRLPADDPAIVERILALLENPE